MLEYILILLGLAETVEIEGLHCNRDGCFGDAGGLGDFWSALLIFCGASDYISVLKYN